MVIDDEELLQLKKEIYRVISSRYDQSIAQLEESLRDLQLSANEETKSSVGDKYETGRSMVQLEIEKLAQQLQQRLAARKQLLNVPLDRLLDAAHFGAVVETDFGNFFLLNNAGDVILNEKKYTSISLQSPLGKLLHGKKPDSVISLNGKSIRIKTIY